jgi:hypothetical protein
MGKSSWTFEVVSTGVPYWSWYAGSAGEYKWILGDKDLIVYGATKPRSMDASDVALKLVLDRDPVETVLFDGCRPGINIPMWANPDIKYLVWFHPSSNWLVASKGWHL